MARKINVKVGFTNKNAILFCLNALSLNKLSISEDAKFLFSLQLTCAKRGVYGHVLLTFPLQRKYKGFLILTVARH